MGCASSAMNSAHRSCIKLLENGMDANRTQTIRITIDNISTVSNDISEDESRIVRRTWSVLANDMRGNGMQVFLRIFEIHPEIKQLFKVENVRHSELARNVVIKGHAARFMSAIETAVDNLDDLDKNLAQLLFTLGQQHKHYVGFKVEYFEVFYEALMWHWARTLDASFTEQVSDSWSHVFVYLMAKLQAGYNSPGPFGDEKAAKNVHFRKHSGSLNGISSDSRYSSQSQGLSVYTMR
ncbi:NGB-like protein [Mya arenaria]|uniref:NGB-like protein n=1 Tax=Mya arenaria TaxID=6604 RepID=A0ABY7FMB4_MYAAR|nr:neuroglobin-like [Mya arenaria]WAR21818.1 NGB-like protein [Mya arenaria]